MTEEQGKFPSKASQQLQLCGIIAEYSLVLVHGIYSTPCLSLSSKDTKGLSLVKHNY